MNDLNPSQFDAVKTLSGPLLVLAGAGTGKTRVVTYRIAELIRHRTAPNRILAVTFTNKAANEMKERSAALLGKKNKLSPEISTFHSLCVRILRRQITNLGYPSEFAICDRGDQEGFAQTALREIRGAEGMLKPGDLLYFVSRWKNASVRPEQAITIAQTDKEHIAAFAYRRYQASLKAAGSLDFDDLLLCAEELFAGFPKIRREEAERFDHLLVDEYQDTNGSQYRIVKALAGGHRNLCVVGDDDQSIYGWRGAEVTHILSFKKDWPEAKVVRLEDNYRSTKPIINWANRLIAFNKLRHDKKLRAHIDGDVPRVLQFENEEDEAKTVVEEIAARLKDKKRQPRDFAILCRTNEQPRVFEQELRRLKIPYVLLGGMSFYDRKEVRDVLAFVKVLGHPSDEVSLRRILNVPPRGISPQAAKKMSEDAIRAQKSLWEFLCEDANLAQFSPAARNGAVAFRTLISQYRKPLEKRSMTDALQDLLQKIRYKEELARLYPEADEAESRWSSVGELINALSLYERREGAEASWLGFVRESALTGPDEKDDKESQLERNAVVMMTLHAAKGLEFPEVYMVGMEENILPHHRSLGDDPSAVDEERRLCYVGVTRAKRRLTLTLSLNRTKWGKVKPTIPSRFLYELTGKADNPNYLNILQGKKLKDHSDIEREPKNGSPKRSPKPKR